MAGSPPPRGAVLSNEEVLEALEYLREIAEYVRKVEQIVRKQENY